MKYKHYAPKARVVIVDADRKTYEDFVNNQKGAFALCFDEDEVSVPRVNFGSENDDLSQARELLTHSDVLTKWEQRQCMPVFRIQRVSEWRFTTVLFVRRHSRLLI